MKPHYTKAPAHVRRAIDRHRQDTAVTTASGGSMSVAAVGVLNWLRASYARGYDIPPDEVPTPAHDRVESFKDDPADLAALRVSLSLELQYERQCEQLAESMRRWASEPSEAELGVARRAELRRQLDELAIEQRAKAIVMQGEAERDEKVMNAARAKARKEIETNVNHKETLQ